MPSFDQIRQIIDDELLAAIKAQLTPGQEFRASEVFINRVPSVKSASLARLVRQGKLLTETKASQGIRKNGGPGSGKSFFSHRKDKYYRLA